MSRMILKSHVELVTRRNLVAAALFFSPIFGVFFLRYFEIAHKRKFLGESFRKNQNFSHTTLL